MAECEDLLIEADALVGELAAADPPTLLDVRWRLTGRPGRDDYTAGHLPAAVFIDLDGELCGPPGTGGRHPLPEPAALQRALRAAGVRGGHPVVVYDGGDGLAASRAWWTLRWAGHERVRVLHGGYPAWLAVDGPVSTVSPTPPEGDIVVRPGALPVLDATAAAELASGGGVLLDVRAAVRYRGEFEPIDPVAGHIPGAVNLPTSEYVAADGRFAPVETLRARFADVGVTDEVSVGAYCGSGVTAAQAVLALHVAGIPDAGLYVGSWSNWVADPSRPVARRNEPSSV